VDSNGRAIWIADPHRDNGKRFVVRGDENLTAFRQLKLAILDREIRCLAAAHEQEVVKNCEHECASHVRTETTKPLGEFC
jgi:hypothetical protein